ncbi:MAG: hypothetical protein QF921_16755 [Pseudomonadales bacterium]|nr:hypothetical protein [Pseudomonadales bacterium]MDP6470617.1 hypothetical protein [Pseudomonadales bacterium]MDP6828528.1 hypothetical protein [Pseudomonadales bacterium]MDP6973135.1 hypothetical protein [Pseudomonadales bacterium]
MITSTGTPMGGGKTVTYKGHTVIHDEAETKMWFYKLLAAGMAMSKDEGNVFTKNLDPGMLVRFLDTPEGAYSNSRQRCRFRSTQTRWRPVRRRRTRGSPRTARPVEMRAFPATPDEFSAGCLSQPLDSAVRGLERHHFSERAGVIGVVTRVVFDGENVPRSIIANVASPYLENR